MAETPAGEETRILVIDNYDSFAYNLVQYVGEAADEVIVRRNDAVDVADVRELDPTGIVISPGPGTPREAGVSIPLFEETDYPILGVCLGHQALCAANGAPVVHAPSVVHGKPSVVAHDGTGLFEGLPEDFQVGRYHSLAVERDALPDALVETARTADEREVLMAVRHRRLPHVGVQFHPESILTRGTEDPTFGEGEIDGPSSDDGPASDGPSSDDSAASDGSSIDDGPAGADVPAERDAGDGISLALGKRMIANFCATAAEVDRP